MPAAADAPVSTFIGGFRPGPGGVMTDEVGVVTGELTLRTEAYRDGSLVLRVQYRDAAEWYRVTGGTAQLNDVSDAEAVHRVALGLLRRDDTG